MAGKGPNLRLISCRHTDGARAYAADYRVARIRTVAIGGRPSGPGS